jgi:hypothetical protein
MPLTRRNTAGTTQWVYAMTKDAIENEFFHREIFKTTRLYGVR